MCSSLCPVARETRSKTFVLSAFSCGKLLSFANFHIYNLSCHGDIPLEAHVPSINSFEGDINLGRRDLFGSRSDRYRGASSRPCCSGLMYHSLSSYRRPYVVVPRSVRGLLPCQLEISCVGRRLFRGLRRSIGLFASWINFVFPQGCSSPREHMGDLFPLVSRRWDM